MNIAKFLRTAFLQKTSGGYFFQLDKVTVQYWASAGLSSKSKTQCEIVSNKKVCGSVQSM